MKKTAQISFRMPYDLWAALEILAHDTGMTVTAYIRAILYTYTHFLTTRRSLPDFFGQEPGKVTWKRVYDVLEEQGQERIFNIRIANHLFRDLGKMNQGNRSALIRSLIRNHIYHQVAEKHLKTCPEYQKMARIMEI